MQHEGPAGRAPHRTSLQALHEQPEPHAIAYVLNASQAAEVGQLVAGPLCIRQSILLQERPVVALPCSRSPKAVILSPCQLHMRAALTKAAGKQEDYQARR